MLNNKIDNNFKEDLEEFIGSRVDRVGLSPSRERRNANKEETLIKKQSNYSVD